MMERQPSEQAEANEGFELTRSREQELTLAVVVLLDALDRCGHGAECATCEPAREAAWATLTNVPSPDAPAERKPERVTLRGRIGTEPAFGATRRGAAVARFPLAVHDENGATSWHTVVAFGDRAERLRGVVGRGDALEVVGYVHERSVRSRGGRPRQVQELYAAAIQPLI